MKSTIELREYERRRVELRPSEVEELLAVGGGAVRVESTAHRGAYDLVAGSLVGSIVTPSLQLLIHPKVELENLLYLLGVSTRDIRWWREHFPYETDQHLVPALFAFFARTLREALAAGLIRSYRWEQERLTTLRGRIDVTELLRAPGRRFPVPCEFEEFTADNALNRFLRAAVRTGLVTAGLPPEVRRLLLGELTRFEEVADVPQRPEALDQHVFTRLDEHYRTPVRLARLILERRTLADRVGTDRAVSFLIDMNRLFEDFVAEGIRRRLAPALGLQRGPSVQLGTGREVPMYPDLVVTSAGQRVYVGDIKYKLNATGIARNADYYQLLAYATALRHDEGLLVYHLDGGAQPPREIEVRGAGTKLVTYLLDISGSPEDIESELDRLRDFLLERIGSGLTQGGSRSSADEWLGRRTVRALSATAGPER
jgi:5-methylcytosine-specific restriction enzyme subunit McrC